jgi:hypothetical protein
MAYARHPVHALCVFLHDLLAGEGIPAGEIDRVLHAAFDSGDAATADALVARLASDAKGEIVRDAERIAARYGRLARRRAG